MSDIYTTDFTDYAQDDLPVRKIPLELTDKINAKDQIHWSLDGAKLYSVHHIKGASAEGSERWVLHLYHSGWALLVWDFESGIWYVNNESFAASEFMPHLIGSQVSVDKNAINEIATLGLVETVRRKMERATK